MKRTTLFLDESVEKELELLAAEAGLSKAAVVREALAQYVLRQRRRRRAEPSFVAVGQSGRSDVAERHEELLEREWGHRG